MSKTFTESFDSARYWRRRYRNGGNSGAGSYGRLASYKADYINGVVELRQVSDVIEFGCGDGNQASLFNFPVYTGVDVSQQIVRACREKFADQPGWQFHVAGRPGIVAHDLAMSLDVIYHLIEDAVFDRYMTDLFDNAKRLVLIYASDKDEPSPNQHVRHRNFSAWVSENRPDWTLLDAPAHPYPLEDGASQKTASFASFKLFAMADKA